MSGGQVRLNSLNPVLCIVNKYKGVILVCWVFLFFEKACSIFITKGSGHWNHDYNEEVGVYKNNFFLARFEVP